MEYYGTYGNYGNSVSDADLAYYYALFARYGQQIITGLIIFVVIALIVALCNFIGLYKIFEKAGEPGWKNLIPVYCIYIRFKIAGAQIFFWVWLILYFASWVFNQANHLEGVIVTLIFQMAAWIVSIIADYKLAKAFGYGAGFTVGLVFLRPVFLLILGCGSAEYEYNSSENGWY